MKWNPFSPFSTSVQNTHCQLGIPGVQAQAWIHGNRTLLSKRTTILGLLLLCLYWPSFFFDHFSVAPSIDDMSDKELTMTVKENESVQLKCAASGQPKPLITWRRADGRPILIDGTSCMCWAAFSPSLAPHNGHLCSLLSFLLLLLFSTTTTTTITR